MLQTVSTASTTTTVTSSSNPSVFGQSVTVTATVTAGSGTFDNGGTVTFSDGGTSLGTTSLSSGGMATITDAALTVAGSPHSITASYSGDTNFTGSSGSVLQTVNTASTSTSVTSSTTASVFGQSVTVTATVSPQFTGSFDNGGTVTFSDGSTSLGTAGLSSGQTTLSSVFTTVATHTITASYSGDTNFTGSSGSVLQIVNKASTTTAVSASNNPSVFGQSVTFTATVGITSPGAGTPSGTVTFSDGSTSLGTAGLSSGQATFTAPSSVINTVATHSITAVYGGDANSMSSTSDTLFQTINRAVTMTTLTSNFRTSAFGQPVSFTATVSTTSLGVGTVVGLVSFLDGTSLLGIGALNNGSVTFTTTLGMADNLHNISAVYAGTAIFAGSPSATLPQTVVAASTSTTISSSANSSSFGQTLRFTATVVSVVSPGTSVPAGTVTFLDGSSTLGTAALAGGKAVLVASALGAGTHTVAAVYRGTSDFNGSSGTLTQSLAQASTATTLVSSLNPSTYGQTVVFTIQVSSGGETPTGTVSLREGGNTLGTAVLDGTGRATVVSTVVLPAGNNVLTAVYISDGNYQGTTSATLVTLVQSVALAATSTAVVSSLNPAPVSGSLGQPVTFTATVTSVAGVPAGTVTFLDNGSSLGTGVLDVDGRATINVTNTLGVCTLGVARMRSRRYTVRRPTLPGAYQTH